MAKREGLRRALADLGNRRVVLGFCDIDRFKAVNDVHGHIAGDDVLRTMATRLSAAVRPVDTVARVGGDELVVVIVDATSEELDALESRLRAAVADLATGHGVSATASIGLSAPGPPPTSPPRCTAAPTRPCTAPRKQRRPPPDGGRGGRARQPRV